MMTLNEQPISKPDMDTGKKTLRVIKIWKTIQGEGPFSGCSAIFVRLAGCNLQCPLCDTEYTQGVRHMSIDQVMLEIATIKNETNATPSLVVLTGGEPFLQNLTALTHEVCNVMGLALQIETNGTTFSRDNLLAAMMATVVCSPKSPTISKDLFPYIDAYKYVLQAGHVCEKDGLPTSVLGNELRVARWYDIANIPEPNVRTVDLSTMEQNVYVQPCDEQNEFNNRENLKVAVSTVMKYGYRLCTQVHKQIGLE
jgi:organic radical activating enzyme